MSAFLIFITSDSHHIHTNSQTVQILSEAGYIHFPNRHFKSRLRIQILTDLIGGCTIKSIDSSWARKPPVVRAEEISCQYTSMSL